MRDEFPFLGEGDCPEVLKILTSDMITAHSRYIKAHGQLYHVANKSGDVCFEVVSDLVNNYIENRSCWDELRHYKDTGEILGKHKLFARRNREAEIRALGAPALMSLYRSLPRSIKYYQDLIERDPDSVSMQFRKEKLAWSDWELGIVRVLLSIREMPQQRRVKETKSKTNDKKRRQVSKD